MRRAMTIVALVALVSLMVTGCGGGQSTKTIKIGHLANVTGDSAIYGQAETNGAKMAAEEINKAGGVLGMQIEIVVGDARSNVTDAVNAVKKLVEQDKVVAVIGANQSGMNIATGPICEAAKVPQIGSFSTNPKVTVDDNGKVKPYSFRICFIDPYQGRVLADYMFNKIGKKKAAILYEVTSDYSVGLSEFFEKRLKELGGEVVAKLAYKGGDVEFRPQLSEIKPKNPEVLLLPLPQYKEIALIAKQAREIGMNEVIFMGGDGYSIAMLEMAGKELQGSYWSTHFSWEDPVMAKFREKFAAKYGDKNPEVNAGMGYDMVYLVADAIKRAGKAEGAAIRDALENTKGLKLQHATITMDPKTHNPIDKEAAILKVEGNEMKLVETYSPR